MAVKECKDERRLSMRKKFILAVAFVWLLAGHAIWAQQKSDDKEHAELAKALKGVKVTLQKGLSASESQGKPISGKFEVEDGKLQLSVYTMKGDKFSEVIVDHKTGKTAKTEAITGGDDLAAAKAQSSAMAKAKSSLGGATAKAVKENSGFRAVSAMPSIKDGHPVAEITLLKGEAFKTVVEKLD
jgi:phosphoglycolate phosphatase-like HAD superfamily hydrolase